MKKRFKNTAIYKYFYGRSTAGSILTALLITLSVTAFCVSCFIYFTHFGIPEFSSESVPGESASLRIGAGSLFSLASDSASGTRLCLCESGRHVYCIAVTNDTFSNLADASDDVTVYGTCREMPTDFTFAFGNDPLIPFSKAPDSEYCLDTTVRVFSPYQFPAVMTTFILLFILLIVSIANAFRDAKLYKMLSVLDDIEDEDDRLNTELTASSNVSVDGNILITESYYTDRRKCLIIPIKTCVAYICRNRLRGDRVVSSALYAMDTDGKKHLLIKRRCRNDVNIPQTVCEILTERKAAPKDD